MSGKPSVVEALAAVMRAVPAVGKDDRNTQQGFNYRGIDGVLNAVGPALREHGVVVMPEVQDVEYSTEEVGSRRSRVGFVRVTVKYRFIGPAGDELCCVVAGEAMDAGDKATPKAMSVAFRTALLQVLAIPTHEPDPDSQSYERSTAPDPAPGADERMKRMVDELDGVYLDDWKAWKSGHKGWHRTPDGVAAAWQALSEIYARFKADSETEPFEIETPLEGVS